MGQFGGGAVEALGLAALHSDFGLDLMIKVSIDANAARCIIERRGLGKAKHAQVDDL